MKFIKNNKKIIIILLFLMFFVFLIYQHQGLYLYFDDYGYASLSYAYNVEQVKGLNYNLTEILQFAKGHYEVWGGRVLFLTIEIIILRYLGLQGFRIIQSLVILGIYACIYLILKNICNKNNDSIKLALLSIISYGIIEIAAFRAGVFWITASVLYIFPVFTMLMYIYMYIRYKDNKNNISNKNENIDSNKEKYKYKNRIINILYIIVMGILVFFTTFSQEQVATAGITIVLINTIYNIVKTKKLDKTDLILFICAIIGFGVLMLAPGNEVRKTNPLNNGFYQLSFVSRTLEQYKQIVINNFNESTKIFTLFFLVATLYCTYRNEKEKKGLSIINHISCLSMIIIFFFTILQPEGYFINLLKEREFHIYEYACILLSIIQLALIIYTYTVYCWNNKNIYLVAILYGSIISQMCMLVAPYFPTRSILMFEILMGLLMIKVLKDIEFNNKLMFYYIAIPCVFVCCLNIYNITKGYHKNIEINKYNDTMLQDAKNNDLQTVTLKKLYNDNYGYVQLYHGIQMVKTYMCEYYDLPTDIEIDYQEP